MIYTKSVHTAIHEANGLRILASRFGGRGLPKTHDVWMPNLGPSEKLLREFKESKVL